VTRVNNFQIGDIVARKAYGFDMPFKIINIVSNRDGDKEYVLRGIFYRIEADAYGSDLEKQDSRLVFSDLKDGIRQAKSFALLRNKLGRILHVDSSKDFLDVCMQHYKENRIECHGKLLSEREQPAMAKSLIQYYKPDIVVFTGHDGYKKIHPDPDSIENFRTSKHFILSAKEARKIQPDFDKLCIFAGACQSPSRVLINALDPALVSEKISMTERSITVTPKEVAALTKVGSDGIGGINTKGRAVKI
jgi:spore coat assembly protein